MPGKIALAGGGNQNDSRLIDEVFASWIEPGRKILYLPLALRGVRPFTECLNWIRAAFLPLNITNIEMWTDLSEHQGDELFDYAAVYIGGGNTYSLLAQCLESGFDRHMVEYVSRGGVIYGGSAGAAILGKDIRTVEHIDQNRIGLIATQGLNIVEGHAVWVHYQPDDDALIHTFVEKYNQSVLAISERAGIVLADSELRSVGFDAAYRFDEHGKHLL
ncbi:MAG: type 1 glutamine amidotransferase-like domain-containing protein [Anaerolineaceae bacterium]|nr:type 1 glutamine amidotransferase-like domain-containing protein [Anaerolineaceae bacterium]